MDIPDLIDRLNGKYTIPIQDGAGPLEGKTMFTRTFETSPIQREAAQTLQILLNLVEDLHERFGSHPRYDAEDNEAWERVRLLLGYKTNPKDLQTAIAYLQNEYPPKN
jgi:hypothetical protein